MNVLTLVFAVQKLLSECQSQRDCQLPVNHLVFGKDPCPGTGKYLHVTYKCKPSEFPHVPPCSQPFYIIIVLLSSLNSASVSFTLVEELHSYTHTSYPSLFPLHSAQHKRHVSCEGETMILRCKPPRVLNIYAAVYGRSLDQTDTCPSLLTRPPPFGESTGNSVFTYCGN